MIRQYQLIGINRKTDKEFNIGDPDTLKRIQKFKWAHTGCIGETYNYYEIREVL